MFPPHRVSGVVGTLPRGLQRGGNCLFLAIHDSNDALMLPALPLFLTPYLLKEEISIGKSMLSQIQAKQMIDFFLTGAGAQPAALRALSRSEGSLCLLFHSPEHPSCDPPCSYTRGGGGGAIVFSFLSR